MHGKHKDMCELGDKGSVASVTRYRRPRADSSHGLSLINALSSFPLSEPSLKELHTSRAPLGLSHRPTETTYFKRIQDPVLGKSRELKHISVNMVKTSMYCIVYSFDIYCNRVFFSCGNNFSIEVS